MPFVFYFSLDNENQRIADQRDIAVKMAVNHIYSGHYDDQLTYVTAPFHSIGT